MPSLGEFVKTNFEISEDHDELEQSFEIIASCIDIIFDAEDSWSAADCTKKELLTWLKVLVQDSSKRLKNSLKPCLDRIRLRLLILIQRLKMKLSWRDCRVFSGDYGSIDLESYYKINFSLIQHHKYSLTEIENLMPWERDIYLGLLNQHIEEENLKAQQQASM